MTQLELEKELLNGGIEVEEVHVLLPSLEGSWMKEVEYET